MTFAAQAQVLRPGRRNLGDTRLGGHGELCDYGDALAMMDSAVERPHTAPDLLISVQHPPTITLGRRGGREHIHGRGPLGMPTKLAGNSLTVDVWDIARGGSVTYHAPGQLVLYPVMQLTRLAEPIGRGPLGDLPAFVRALEQAMLETCATFGLPTLTREGFSGLWIDEQTKIASIGVGVRRGWSFHGLALNVCPHLEGFDLITPCGLQGVRMTTMWRQLDERQLPRPSLAQVETELIERLLLRLVRVR